jgi:hypothetical protein
MRDTKGGKAIRLGEGFPAGFSRDGGWVLAMVPSRPARLVVYPTGAGTERAVPLGDVVTIGNAGWGSDDGTVWYCGSTATQERRCRSQTLAGGPATTIEPGIIGPSPDGQFAVAWSSAKTLMLMTTRGDTVRPVPGSRDGDIPIRWSADGRSLWVGSRGKAMAEALDLTSGARSPLVSVLAAVRAGESVTRSLVLADDPRTFAFTPDHLASELFVVTGVP